MALIQGNLQVNGIPRNDATAKLWSAGAFLTPPEKDTPIPTGTPIATGTTDPENGADGNYRFEGVTVGEYWVSLEWNGAIVYDYFALNINPTVSVRDFGAVGDGMTDDTIALQAALNAAAVSGGFVYAPAGTYITSAPLTVAWTATPDVGLPTDPIIGGFFGDGNHATIIQGTISGSGRAVLEFTGTRNTHAVNMSLRDLRVDMATGSVSGAYCLRVGDAKNFFLAERVNFTGANGIMLKIASSTSYAQIGTEFRQCTIETNYASGWFADEGAGSTFLYAIFPESGGALFDNVRFDSCTINGYVEPRASQMEFDNCQFYVHPGRGIDGSNRNFGMNVAIRLGCASFNNCYFEDYHTAIFITPGVNNIDNVTINGCHFTGRSNYPSQSGTLGIHIVDAVNELNSVSVRDCRFGDEGFISGSIRINGGKSVTVDNCVNIQTATNPIRILKVKPNWAIQDGRTTTPRGTEVYKFYGSMVATTENINARLNDHINSLGVAMNKPCWISKINVFIDDHISTGTLTINVKKNGVTVVDKIYPTVYTVVTGATADYGYYEPAKSNPSSVQIFDTADKLTLQVVTATITPLNIPFRIEIEFAY